MHWNPKEDLWFCNWIPLVNLFNNIGVVEIKYFQLIGQIDMY